MKVALEIFNGDLKGYVMLPDEKDVREALLKAFMKDLLKSSISEQIQKLGIKDYGSSTRGAAKSDYEPEAIAIKVTIEFCLNIGAVDFLFLEMFELFDSCGLRPKLFSNLEPFIISGQFKKEVIPEQILSDFLDHFGANQGNHIKQKNLERVIQQLDFNLYSVDMRARLEVLCQHHCMVSALIYLQRSLKSQECILSTMFKLMKQVQVKEQKRMKETNQLPF